MTKESKLVSYFTKNWLVVLGLVLVWRGTWYVLDWVDLTIFNNEHFFTAIAGIIIGLIVLYLPDHDLKEIQKL